MSKNNIIWLIQSGNVNDQLTEILRNGAKNSTSLTPYS